MYHMAKPPAIRPLGLQDLYVRGLIYGEPGVGKTTLIASSPKCLILNADQNLTPAILRGMRAEVWDIFDWNDFAEAVEYLRMEGYKDFDWAWLDSVTIFQEKGLDSIMANLIEGQGKSHRLMWAPDRGEYGQNMSRLSQNLRTLMNVPINWGVTAHVMNEEYDDEGHVRTMPLIQGKNMPARVCSYMNVVGYLHARIGQDKKTERSLITRKSAKFYAKDSFDGALGGQMLDPTIPKIMGRVQAKLEQARAAKVAANGTARKGAPTKAVAKKAPAKKAIATTRKAS